MYISSVKYVEHIPLIIFKLNVVKSVLPFFSYILFDSEIGTSEVNMYFPQFILKSLVAIYFEQ